ncbi:sulfotransferase [Myxococcota bacterium]|nr:sulfotransferase [Myxococcota bacterium]
MICSASEMVDRARERSGLSNFGPTGWEEGLERLVSAVEVDIGENPAAIEVIEAILTGRLINRLRTEKWYEDHAESASQPVDGPVVILGLPRTSTTALQYLLAVDPQFRFQRTWEVMDPVPPPEAATEEKDPRRLSAVARPNVQHISSVDGPIEDVIVLSLHFHNQELGLPVPTFTRWWRSTDLTSTFAYHERVLRMLHAHRPPFLWLLKTPLFMFHLDQLSAHYPNARFLMTHRNPVASFPSACSTVLAAQQGVLPAHQVDPIRLGNDLLEHLVEGARRTIAERLRLGEERFFDIGEGEIESKPIETVERIYSFLGLDLSDATRAAMAQWALDNRRGSRGVHHYAPEDYGCKIEGVSAAFAEYMERFAPFIVTDTSA